jgi:hypothetical protein
LALIFSGASFNSQNNTGNSFRIRKKLIPDPRGKKAPNPGSTTLVSGTGKEQFFYLLIICLKG